MLSSNRPHLNPNDIKIWKTMQKRSEENLWCQQTEIAADRGIAQVAADSHWQSKEETKPNRSKLRHAPVKLATQSKCHKLAPCKTRLMVDSSHLTFLPSSKSHDTKIKTNIKNSARSNLDIVPRFKNQCQLPLQMATKIAFENGRISNFQGLRTWTLDRVILHTVVHHSSTYTYITKFYWNRSNFLWTDRHLRPPLLGRLLRVDLKI